MSDLLFDTPWWLLVAIGAVGIMVFVSGNRRQRAALQNAGAGLFGLAMVLVLLTIFVDTPKKIARRDSKALIEAAATRDWPKFRSLLATNADLRLLGSAPMYDNGNDLTDVAKAGVEAVHLREAHIRSLSVDQTDDVVTASLDIFTEQDDASAPMIESSWQFDFKKTPAGWRISELRATSIGQLAQDDAERLLPKPRQ